MYTFKCISDASELSATDKSRVGLTVANVIKNLRRNGYFVTVSNDVLCTLESTNLTRGSYNSERKNVAVILGNDKSSVKVKSFYSNSHSVSDPLKVPTYALQELVLDCTTEESIKDLSSKGLVNSKTTGAVNKEDGIFVYGGVKKDCVKVLNNLEMDALYALLSSYGVTANNITAFIRVIAPSIDYNLDNYSLSPVDRELFHAMFVENLDLTTIMHNIMKSNNVQAELIRREDDCCMTMPDYSKDLVIINYDDEFDPLNILAYLKNKKRTFVKMVLDKLDLQLSDIKIVEDKLLVSRVGATFQDDEVVLEFRDMDIVIPTQVYEPSTTMFNGRNIVSAVMNGNTDMDLYNCNSVNMGIARENELNKNNQLSKTPKK